MPRPLSTARAAGPGTADVGLVRLEARAQRLSLRPHHRLRDLVQPGPGGLVAAEAHLALELHRRDPALARGDQEDRQKTPGVPGLGLLEDGPGEERVLLAAGGTLVDQPRLVRPRPLMAAGGAAKAVGPARPEQIVPALVVGPKAFEKARQIARPILWFGRIALLQPTRHRRQTTSTARRDKPNLSFMDS